MAYCHDDSSGIIVASCQYDASGITFLKLILTVLERLPQFSEGEASSL
jgi:hypothetical protein